MFSFKRLLLAVLVRPKLRSKCVYVFLLFVVFYVFLHLTTLLKSKTPTPIEITSLGNLVKPRYKQAWTDDADQRGQNARYQWQVGERTDQVISDDVWRNDFSGKTNGIDADSVVNIRNGPRRQFIFALRYYEQLGRATNNLITLASLAKYKNRQVVAPFVNNSRMSGLRGGVSHHVRKIHSDFRFGKLDEYFDVAKVNYQLKSHGYSTMADFQDFETHCNKRLNVVVHFLYDPTKNSAVEDAISWYRMDRTAIEAVYKQTKEKGGWDDCPFLKRSMAEEQMGFRVSRYMCVDPTIITTAHELEEKVLKGAQCVGLIQWKGIGEGRTHFHLARSITQPLKPSDLKFNPRLVELAKKFVQHHLGDNFIAVHVRSERHIVWKGINVTLRCIHKLARRIGEAQAMYKIPTLFLASDLTDHGSDTLISESKAHLSRSIHESLNFPVTFEPRQEGLYDNGAAAIVEMNILALGTRLFTLGGGNFQEWAVNLFFKRHQMEKTGIHRICEIRQ